MTDTEKLGAIERAKENLNDYDNTNQNGTGTSSTDC